MEFNGFKEEACGRDEKRLPKSTLGLTYCIPVAAEDDSGDFELSIDEMMTITKPSINLIYVSDPFRVTDFIRLDLEFISGYDLDMQEIFDFLKTYEKKASDFFDDVSKCPAFFVSVVPNNIVTEGIHYMELNMPMMISLTSNKPNQAPNMISMLFTADNCSLHEEELINVDDVKREVAMEYVEAVRNEMIKLEEEETNAARQKQMEKLQEQINNFDENEHLTRVGRGSEHEDKDN